MGNIYNFGLFGHNKSGKTTLGEAILFKGKAIDRMGNINQGNTCLDYDVEEIKRLMSINLSIGNLKWKDKKLYFADTPGYMDFVGEQISGIKAVDFAILNISADSGIEVGTEKLWEMIQKEKLPCLIFINKLDLPDINLTQLFKNIQSFFGKKTTFINLPVFENGKLNCVKGIFDYNEENEFLQSSIDNIMELDDSLMEKYLEGEKISMKEISQYLKKGIMENKILPVLCGSAINQIGIEELLDFIINFMPSSDELPPLKGKNSNGEEIERERKADGPLSGIVFKTIFDPFIGRVSYLRIFSGKLLSNSVLFNSTKNKKERIGQLLKLTGKKQEPVSEAIAGEFVAIPKISAETFDTFSDPNDVIIYPPPALPEGALSLSIAPKVKGTEDKLGNAIGRILEEDPTIKIFRDNETGETIISGMGELHLDVTINKFKNKFGVEVKKGIPKIAYKETITKSANAEGKYKRQTGGRGQYGHCFIKVEPLPRGAGFEFVDKIVGGVIPRNFIPSVEKGVRQAMQKGVLANYPIVDIKVTLYDGSYHPVDSSDIAFQIAGSMALQKAVKEAGLILLEPIVNVEIRVPQEFVGDIIGSINAKRGKVLDMIPSGSTHIIKAQVPLAEMANYTTELRSITSGRGSYTMEFSHYQEVPPHIAQKIIEERKKEKEGKE